MLPAPCGFNLFLGILAREPATTFALTLVVAFFDFLAHPLFLDGSSREATHAHQTLPTFRDGSFAALDNLYNPAIRHFIFADWHRLFCRFASAAMPLFAGQIVWRVRVAFPVALDFS